MKKEIHPEYQETRVTCSCGETFTTRSTKKELRVEICSKCHPFYTGKQKFVDTGGRVERFQKKYGDVKAPVKAKKETEKDVADLQVGQEDPKEPETEKSEPEAEETNEENAAESQDS